MQNRDDYIAEIIEKFQLELDELTIQQLKEILLLCENSSLLNSKYITDEVDAVLEEEDIDVDELEDLRIVDDISELDDDDDEDEELD